jgi:hypothetical protein
LIEDRQFSAQLFLAILTFTVSVGACASKFEGDVVSRSGLVPTPTTTTPCYFGDTASHSPPIGLSEGLTPHPLQGVAATVSARVCCPAMDYLYCDRPLTMRPPDTAAPPTTVTPTTTTTQEPATLGELVAEYFVKEDWPWALRVAFCESSAQPGDTTSTARHNGSGASGWFQHLPKFWEERTGKAGVPGADIMEPETNVLVAAWLLYETTQGKGHWNESKHCWG